MPAVWSYGRTPRDSNGTNRADPSMVLALTLSGLGQGREPGVPRIRRCRWPGPSRKSESCRSSTRCARSGKTYLSVPVSDGRVLRLLTETVGAKTVVEIGTSTGYSGLWFCLALQKTGGKLTTFEVDSGRAATARKHFEQAGVARLVNVIEGDAHRKWPGLKGPIDLAFIDADKEGYVDYLNKLLPPAASRRPDPGPQHDHGGRQGRVHQAGPGKPRPGDDLLQRRRRTWRNLKEALIPFDPAPLTPEAKPFETKPAGDAMQSDN